MDLMNSPTIWAFGSIVRPPRLIRWPSRNRSASSSLMAVCFSSSTGAVCLSLITRSPSRLRRGGGGACLEPGPQPFAKLGHDVRRGRLWRARREGRLRIILDAELDALRHLVSGDSRGQSQGHVDARRDPRRGDDLALHDHPLQRGARAQLAERVEGRPVRGRLQPLEKAGGAEQERAGAGRGRPLAGRVRLADPVQQGIGSHERARAEAARHHDDLRMRHGGEGLVSHQRDLLRVGAVRAGRDSDEAHPGAGEAREHLVGTNGVQSGEAVEERDGDVHGVSLASSREAACRACREPAVAAMPLIRRIPPRSRLCTRHHHPAGRLWHHEPVRAGRGREVRSGLEEEGGGGGGGIMTGEIQSAGARVEWLKMDAADPDGAQALVWRALDAFGQIDVMVNNAGYAEVAPLEEITLESWNRVLAVTLTGTFLGMKYCLPVMRRQGNGAIVNTASISGTAGDYGLSSYNAAKAGVINLTGSAAIENAKYGIRVNCVCPGTIETRAPQLLGGDRADEIRREQAAANPVARMGQADEIANAIFFLASDESSFITGAAITADGGLTAHTGLPPFRRLADSA